MLPNLLLKSTNDNLIFSQFGSNKNNRRDWTYIDDLVNLVISIIDNYRFKTYEILNIGRSKAVGIEDFIHIFSSLLKKKIE
jgi:nucleoside-diphosphate-sugar epimerase